MCLFRLDFLLRSIKPSERHGFLYEMTTFHDEVEIEDFEFDEETEKYHYPCPCGDRFEITLQQVGPFGD